MLFYYWQKIGPDHLAGILPISMGLKGTFGLRIGAIWGLGHGLSAMALGMGMFFLKDTLGGKLEVVKKLSNVAETVVGFSLVTIGLIGIKENMAHKVEPVDPSKDTVDITDNVLYHPEQNVAASGTAVFANGLLHGCSLDGAPSILPAIAMNSWGTAVTFLTAYCFGTMLTMSLTAGIIGELSTRLGKALDNPDLPRNLSLGSSAIAILIGVFWIIKCYI